MRGLAHLGIIVALSLLTASISLAQVGAESAQLESAAPSIGHPTKAVCRVCEAKGGAHGEENVAAWREHDGTFYYFCAEDCAAAFDANAAAYAIQRFPRPAPAGLVRTLEGEPATLESLRGGVTLIDFWATWCKPCLKTMPKIQSLHDELSSQGFRAVGVAIDEHGDEAVRKFVQKKGFTYPIVIDDETAPSWASFSVVAVPAMYLVDRDGQIISQWTGEVDWKQVDAAVRSEVARSAH